MKKIFILVLASVILAFASASSSAVTPGFYGPTSNFIQSYQPTFNELYAGDFSTYWPILSRMETDQCYATSDFVIGIPPGGCSPAVVRSDLLEEQNVPVFCQLYAIKINPLIRVSTIKSISFKGNYPDGVSGISFHPAQAAVRSYTTLLGNPTLENIGYVVIILKQNRVEKNMEEWVAGNLTATIYYDAEEAFGTGRADYYLPLMSDNKWQQQYEKYSFWYGKGFLRLTSTGAGTARIDVMQSKDSIVRSYNLREGETGEMMYFPGYYCRAGLEVRLNGIVAPENSALLNIDGTEYWVREGSRILNDQCSVTRVYAEENFGNVTIMCPGQTIILSTSKEDGTMVDDVTNVDEDFNEADKAVRELMDKYPLEKKDRLSETWGEEALYNQIQLAGMIGKTKTKMNLMNEFIKAYPTSPLKEKVQFDLMRMNGTNYNNSFGSVIVSNKFHSISVVEFQAYDKASNKVELTIGTQTVTLGEGETKTLSESDNAHITAMRINPNAVQLKYYQKDKKGMVINEKYATIMEGGYGTLGEWQVYVSDINVPVIAHVTLSPVVKATKTEADFSFKIGIEKRAIQLSTDKTKEMLANLNKSIQKWEDINKKLNTLVKAWKGACFATSGVLIAKNMISGFSGESLARQKVMAQYKQICASNYSTLTRTECYNKLANNINGDVEKMTGALNSINDIMDASVDKYKTTGLLGEGTITNQTAYNNDLRTQLAGWSFAIPGIDATLTPNDLTTTEQIKAAMLEMQTRGQGLSHDVAKAEAEVTLRSVALYKESETARNNAIAKIKAVTGSSTTPQVQVYNDKKTTTLQWGGQKYSSYNIQGVSAKSDDKIQFLNYNGDDYLLVLDGSGLSSQMTVKNAYVLRNNAWTPATENEMTLLKKIVFSTAGASGMCNNQWTDGTASVSYYESGNDKGLPAIVPFNLREGWYAMVPNSGGTFLEDSPQGYKASGDVSYFKICNIGKNKLMESGSGDDLCQTFDVNTAGSVNNFIPCPSLDSTKVRELYIQAKEAIREAAQQKDSKYVTIFGQRMEIGQPMSKVTGYECQDFMSPEDCKLMFNVCDPVICPLSRCDLGGKMPVSDVIQTGIIGSLVLCLPNMKEGIVVPICVSGIAAGIDSYVSILEAERKCLQTSIETGQHVGICDEITSIYMCEFFWRQLSPVLDMIAPRIIEMFYGGSQRARGGGEYMLVQSAWDNTQKSIDYFKNVYAPNAFRVFQLRNIQEAGTEVCRAFVGTSFPASAEGIDSLLEPESPSQFYAQFSEVLFTEATVPSTSQYKVYYHIFAGNDIGAQYRVYLKSPPEYSYYAASPIINVKTGYVAKGDYADETMDFTAPSGYKELCVQINAQEECGFKQVSSSLAVDYLSAKYTKEQAETSNIKTEKECISGTPSALPMVNLNIQQGVEGSVSPEIGLNGIVRVCATGNPGVNVNDLTRWKDVGYCGDENMRCWFDVQSVKSDLQKVAAIEGNNSIPLLEKQQGLIKNEQMTQEGVQATLASARTKIKVLSDSEIASGKSSSVIAGILDGLNNIIGVTGIGAGTNADRAEALSLKATVFRMITLELYKPNAVVATGGISAECTDTKPCEVGVCKNGICVMCKEDADCPTEQACNLDTNLCVGRIEKQNSDCKKDAPIWLAYGEQANNVWVKFDSGVGKWMYSLTNKNDYLAISPTLKIKFGDISLSDLSTKDFEAGCTFIDSIPNSN